jgi:sulfate adenylyltransferase subunit 2
MSALDYLQRLEAESIHIFREVIAECEKPVMLYSVGKDSSVMLHLARKAFAPAKPPFPLLQIASGWDFREMLEFRDATAEKFGLELLVHTNEEGERAGVKPWTHGATYSDIMLTQALRQALDKYGFDAAFGGGRRDEEKSRAKERIISFRNAQHRWDPRRQRPELWRLYNTYVNDGESIRVFPLSNWTELDVWRYVERENIEIPSLYFARARPVVRREGTLIVADDARLTLRPGEAIEMRQVRFRTLGCYPLTGAIDSHADTLEAIIEELLASRRSERQGRVIDHDRTASMEAKKQQGYF